MQNTWDFPHSGLNLHTGSIECQVLHEVKLRNCQSWHLFHFVQRLYLHLQAVRLGMEKRNWILDWLNGLKMWKIKYHCLPTPPELKWLFPEWLSFCWCWLPLSTLCLWRLSIRLSQTLKKHDILNTQSTSSLKTLSINSGYITFYATCLQDLPVKSCWLFRLSNLRPEKRKQKL